MSSRGVGRDTRTRVMTAKSKRAASKAAQRAEHVSRETRVPLAARWGWTSARFVSEGGGVRLADIASVSNKAGGQAYDLLSQGEVGVRADGVTGVQTCALPISTALGDISIGANNVGNTGAA